MKQVGDRKEQHATTGGGGRQTITVVERAFFVLQTVAASGQPLGVRELARRTDLSPATVLRLVRTLDAIGMVHRLPDGQVVLGDGVHSIAGDGSPALGADRFRPILSRIVELFDEAATAAIDEGDNTLFLAHVAPRSAVQVADVEGDRWPAHTTASGLVLMAAWDDNRLGSYLAGDLNWNAPRTVTDPAELRRRVARVRKNGFAWSIDELVADTAGLAVPVRGADGHVIAAVGLYGPTYRLHPDLDGMANLPARLAQAVGSLTPALTGGRAAG